MCPVQVKFIPEQDLRVIDALWRASSDGKFGYSAQKELWVQNRRYWERLFKVIDWTHGEHNFYRCYLNSLRWTLTLAYTWLQWSFACSWDYASDDMHSRICI